MNRIHHGQPAHASAGEGSTLADALRAFLAEFAELVRQGLRSAGTLAMHTEHVGFWLEHAEARLPLAEVSDAVIYSLARAESAGRRDGLRLSNGTLRKRLSTLRQALALAGRRPQFPRIEFRYRPRRDHLRSLAELEVLAMTLPLERAEWLYFAALTGLHPADVNRARAYVDVDPFASPPWYVARNTKNRDPDGKPVELAAPLAALLRRRFKRERLRPGDPAVVPWDKDSASSMLRRRAKLLGMPGLRRTTMRHTFITWAVDELGTITRALQETVGHHDFAMMDRTYAHALRPRFAEVAAAVARKATRTPRLPPLKSSPRSALLRAGKAKRLNGGQTPPGASRPGRRRCSGSG